ncbi:MAG: tRNA pseudouridine(55) synthase TruB [Syntrophobacteraceae bacterium]
MIQSPTTTSEVISYFTERSSRPVSDSGILVIDKPEGMTSFAVVAKVRKGLGLKKTGHCGTLDPFATGVLVVCVEKATRIADCLLNQDKIYRFRIRLGVETNTLDRTGNVTRTSDGPPRSGEDLEAALDRFRGCYLQEVPAYAAVKVQGRRLYDWSRNGIEVDRPKREVCIHSLKLLEYGWPYAALEAHCSKGTYIRQLSADIGRFLGCGAHVTELRRIASGSFTIEQAIELSDFVEASTRDSWRERLVPMSAALSHLPAITLNNSEILKRLKDGCLDPSWESEHRKLFSPDSGPVRMVDEMNRLIALWWPHHSDQQGRRLRVFQS